jgi:hypothetical protein
MKITTMPKETLSELIHFIAENERFASVGTHLGTAFALPQVRAALREVAEGLAAEARAEQAGADCGAGHKDDLSSRAREIISSLTQAEEKKLLSAFGLIAD